MSACRFFRNRFALFAFILFGLVACGGGGGGAEPPVVQPPVVQPPVAPAVATQPQSQTVVAGNSVTFTVAASGDAPLSYQWLRNGAEVVGATQSSFTIGAVLMQDSGTRWSVRVANAAGGSSSSEAVLTVTPAPIPLGISLTAGSASGAGNLDGKGRAAYFNDPRGLVFGVDGSLLVSDSQNRTIRRVGADGSVTTVAGQPGVSGSQDGANGEATFSNPADIVLAKDGNLYVVDEGKLRGLTPQGTVVTMSAPTSLRALATAPDGTLYGATDTAVWRLTPLPQSLCSGFMCPATASVVAGDAGASGTSDGTGGAARFFAIGDIAVDSAGTIYASEPRTHTIRKITSAGVVTTLAGSVSSLGSVDGTGSAARFSVPGTLALDGAGNLWVAELGSGRFRKVTPAGEVTTPFGATRGFFSNAGAPKVPMAFGASGELYFSVGAGVSRIDAAGTLVPVAGQDFDSSTALGSVAALATDAAGNVIVATQLFGALRFDKYTVGGERLPFEATVPVSSFPPNSGVGADAQGNVYVSSVTTTSGGINVFIPTGGSITKVASDGTVSSLVSWPPNSANPLAPGFLSVGRDGAFYFVDLITGNLVKWTAAAGATTIANVGPVGLLFSLAPWLITADASGKVHVVRNRVVQRVENGVLVTVAGAAGVSGTTDGPGAQARFVAPSAVAVDAAGNLFIADREVVRKVAPDGVVSTVAGQRGRIGLRTGALPGSLGTVGAIAVGPDGLLHVVSDNALVKVRFN